MGNLEQIRKDTKCYIFMSIFGVNIPNIKVLPLAKFQLFLLIISLLDGHTHSNSESEFNVFAVFEVFEPEN